MHRFGFLMLGAIAMTLIAGPGPANSAGRELTQAVFSAAERAIIADYYGDSEEGPAQGKGKNKGNKGNRGRGVGSQGLPPGLADRPKLPPGIAKRQLPARLTSQLPPAPTGFERAIVDNDLVLVEIATQLVHDIITDIISK